MSSMFEFVDLPLLFSQLQARYPTGSLVSELVQVHSDRFIVRASVQVSGSLLATSLAAAATVEQAEDQAKLRVLALLGIGTIPSGLSTPLPTTGAMLTGGLSNGSSLPKPTEPLPLAKPIPAPVPIADIAPLPSMPPLPLEPLPTMASAHTAPPELDRLPALVDDSPPDMLSPDMPPFDQEPVATVALPEPRSPITRPVKPPPPESAMGGNEPVDLSELIALSDVEMDRVGWSKKRGQSHLKRTYGKQTRAELNEDQLLEFLHYLRALPSQSLLDGEE